MCLMEAVRYQGGRDAYVITDAEVAGGLLWRTRILIGSMVSIQGSVSGHSKARTIEWVAVIAGSEEQYQVRYESFTRREDQIEAAFV